MYLRYDPEDLSKVRVYDMEDRFLTEAPQSKLTAGTWLHRSRLPS